jgi:hypothetical protein
MKRYLSFYKTLHYFVIIVFIALIAFIFANKAQAHVFDIHVPTPEDVAREVNAGKIPTPGGDISCQNR